MANECFFLLFIKCLIIVLIRISLTAKKTFHFHFVTIFWAINAAFFLWCNLPCTMKCWDLLSPRFINLFMLNWVGGVIVFGCGGLFRLLLLQWHPEAVTFMKTDKLTVKIPLSHPTTTPHEYHPSLLFLFLESSLTLMSEMKGSERIDKWLRYVAVYV